MVNVYRFGTVEDAAGAMLRWWSLPRYKRAEAIVKQNGLTDTSEIWQRDSRGKCVHSETFNAELHGERMVFDYFGSIWYGEAQYPEWCTNKIGELRKWISEDQIPAEVMDFGQYDD